MTKNSLQVTYLTCHVARAKIQLMTDMSLTGGGKVTYLKKMREIAKMSQSELAVKAGVSERSVIRWERGESLTTKNLQKLAAALNVTPNELLGVEGKEKTK